MVIVENSHRIKAASLWAPAVTDFPESVAFFARKRRVNTPQFEQLKLETDKLIEQYGASSFSSLSQVSKVNSPLIIHHGTADESVPYSWGLALNKALQDAGKSVTFHTYTGANHDIAQSWSTALSRDLAFFRSHLER